MFGYKKKPTARPSTIITLAGPSVRVSLCEARFFTEKEMDKLQDAMCIISYVIHSLEFYAEILRSSFTSTLKSNIEVYDLILKGREFVTGVSGTFGMDQREDDYELDFVLEAYNATYSKVLGYVVPGKLAVHMNRKYFGHFDAWEVAGNLFHEKTHQLGFDHISAQDHQSVPYKLGYLMRDLGARFHKEAIAKNKHRLEVIVKTGELL